MKKKDIKSREKFFITEVRVIFRTDFSTVIAGGADQTGKGVEDPPCIMIGFSNRLVPMAEKGPPAMYQDRVCFGDVLS